MLLARVSSIPSFQSPTWHPTSCTHSFTAIRSPGNGDHTLATSTESLFYSHTPPKTKRKNRQYKEHLTSNDDIPLAFLAYQRALCFNKAFLSSSLLKSTVNHHRNYQRYRKRSPYSITASSLPLRKYERYRPRRSSPLVTSPVLDQTSRQTQSQSPPSSLSIPSLASLASLPSSLSTALPLPQSSLSLQPRSSSSSLPWQPLQAKKIEFSQKSLPYYYHQQDVLQYHDQRHLYRRRICHDRQQRHRRHYQSHRHYHQQNDRICRPSSCTRPSSLCLTSNNRQASDRRLSPTVSATTTLQVDNSRDDQGKYNISPLSSFSKSSSSASCISIFNVERWSDCFRKLVRKTRKQSR